MIPLRLISSLLPATRDFASTNVSFLKRIGFSFQNTMAVRPLAARTFQRFPREISTGRNPDVFLRKLLVMELHFSVLNMEGCYLSRRRRLYMSVVNERLPNGKTLIQETVDGFVSRNGEYEGFEKVISALLDLGADPNIKDDSGNTILHQLVVCSPTSDEVLQRLTLAVQSLLYYGADPYQRNSRGETLVQVVKTQEVSEIILAHLSRSIIWGQ